MFQALTAVALAGRASQRGVKESFRGSILVDRFE
jgi:hypothetical protein